MSEHSLVLDIVIRFLRLLGCPHACGEKMVSFVTFLSKQFLPHHCHHEQGVGECWVSSRPMHRAPHTTPLDGQEAVQVVSISMPSTIKLREMIICPGSSPTLWSRGRSTSCSTSCTPTWASAPSSPIPSHLGLHTPGTQDLFSQRTPRWWSSMWWF